jgi:4-amino-4-deoxy-L-arabinose transferase-like glycosyltransferase
MDVEAPSSPRRPLGWLAVLVVVGLSLRLLPVLCYGNADALYLASDSDSWGYHRLASSLLAGHGYTWDVRPPYAPNLYRPPGFPLLLLTVYALTGPWFVAAVVLQALAGTAVIVLVFLLARRLGFSTRVALLAAAVQALDPVAIHYCNALMTETYTSALLLLTLGCLVRYQKSAHTRWLLAAGGLLAAGILVHPVLLLLPLLLPVVPWLTPGTRSPRQFAAAAAALVLALAPASAWVLRNWHAGDFLDFSSVEAVNLLKYKAAGVEAALRGTARGFERDRLTRECEAALPPDATPGERYRLWRQRGLAIILGHPLVYARLHLQGMLMELFGPERDQTTRLLYGRATLAADGRCTDASIAAARDRPVLVLEVARYLILAWQGLLCVGLVGGTCWMARRRPWMLLGLLVVPLYILTLSGGPEGSPRFRVSFLPVLSLLTGVGVQAALGLLVALRRLFRPELEGLPAEWTPASHWAARRTWRQDGRQTTKPAPKSLPPARAASARGRADKDRMADNP